MSGYLGSFFGVNDADEGVLEMMVSADAENFTSIAWPLPGGVFERDASVYYDGAYFWLCFTTGGTSFPVYQSTGPGNPWTLVATVDCSTLPSGTNYDTWAPEWFIDDDSSVHVIVAISLGPYPFEEQFVPYEVHPTNDGMTAWSTPASMTLVTTSIPTSAFDYFLVSPNNSPTGLYTLWYHDQNGGSYIQYATSSTLTGTYTYQTTGNWAGWGSGLEGPCLLKIGADWYLYFDNDDGALYSGQIQYSISSDNWSTWSTPADIGQNVAMTKQGTVIDMPDLDISDAFSSGIRLGSGFASPYGVAVSDGFQLGLARLGAGRLGLGPTSFSSLADFTAGITLGFETETATVENIAFTAGVVLGAVFQPHEEQTGAFVAGVVLGAGFAGSEGEAAALTAGVVLGAAFAGGEVYADGITPGVVLGTAFATLNTDAGFTAGVILGTSFSSSFTPPPGIACGIQLGIAFNTPNLENSAFTLQKVIVTFKPVTHMPVRGAV
jgi:hypothetical protein